MTPNETRDALLDELSRRRPLVNIYDSYMQGRQVCGFSSAKDREVAEMIAAVADNWCELVVVAATERMDIQGLRMAPAVRPEMGEENPLANDFAAWDLWRRNGLDEDLNLLFDTAVSTGEAYLLVWPAEEDSDKAEITIEHPSQMVVSRDARDRRNVTAALKFWADDEEEHVHLWRPEGLYRWSRPRPGDIEATELFTRIGFVEPEWTAGDFARNPFPVVPVFPVVNRPQARPARPPSILLRPPHSLASVAVGLGKSDLANVISTQDEINQLLRGMLVASEYQAYQQRYVAGLERPEEDEAGEPLEPPFVAGPGKLWEAEDPNTKFGAFPAADLKMFLDAMDNRVQSMASRSATPRYYFGSGNISNVSEGGLKAQDTGLVARVRAKFRPFGGGITRAVRCALAYENVDYENVLIDIDWSDPEARSEGQHVDAAIKKLAAGVPLQQIWEDLNYSPEQIGRFRGWALQNAQEAWLLDPVARADALESVASEPDGTLG